MEDWQRRVIQINLPNLIRDTQCNKTLLAILFAKELISHEERIKIDVTPSPIDKADYLYKIIVTRKNGYEGLLEATHQVKQSGVSHILEQRKRNLYLFDALAECNVQDFRCQRANNIDFSDFHGISTAIVEYVDVEKFKSAVKTESLLLRGPKKETYLHVAAAYGYVKVIDYLIEKGLRISTVDDEGRTPGHYIGKFSTNIIETLKTLKKHGLNLRQTDGKDHIIKIGYGDLFTLKCKEGAAPLHHALEILDLEKETIDFILRSTKVDINQAENNGSTLLLLAFEFGRSLETIKSLISLGSSIKIKNKDGSGALHLAVVGGNVEVIQYLISRGLNINEKYKYKRIPLHFVSQTRTKNYVELTKLLLENGADLYSKNNDGNTLAHEMAASTDVSCEDFTIWVTAMIENGNAHLFTIREELYSRTPLHCSMERWDLDLETIKLIIESAKLDINQQDENGDTVLHAALEHGRSLNTIKNLIECGADWKKKGLCGRSVLHFAVKGSNKEAFLYFKSLGVDVNAKDEYGNTPLHKVPWIKNRDYLGMTKFLLENGADPNAKEQYGETLDRLMSTSCWISAEEKGVWKEEMIKLEHSSLFKN